MQDCLPVLDHFDQAQIAESLKRVAVAVVPVGDPSPHGEIGTSRSLLLCDRSTQDVPVIAVQAWEHNLLGCSHRGVHLV